MWEVIGFEKSFVQRDQQSGYEAITLHVKKPVQPGSNAAGCRCKSYWYRAHEISYVPQVGDTVIVETEVRGKYEIIRDIQKI
ncbi:MAG: hypothetical protein IJZ38_03180 [Bacteroides sp.]|nr:hypothetical protein [Bacteroides sp.]